MALLRLFGSFLILVGVIALVSDITRMQMRDRPALFASVERHLTEIAPQALSAAQSGVQRLHPALWDPVALKAMQVPTWMAFGASGLALCYLGRRRRRVNVFAN